MAFPDVTTLLDDFNRANENPVDGGVWGGAPRSAVNAVHQVVNNRLTDTARSLHETYYDGVSISGQMQLYFTIVDRNVQGVGIVVTSTIGNADGYIAYQEGNSSGAIYRFDNDTLTSIDTYSGTSINNGHKYGAEFNDNGSTIAIQAYADTGSGWGAISGATVNDATYQGETFYPWVRSLSTSSFLIELDDFSGGEVSSGADVTPDPLTMTLSVVDPTAVKGSISKTPAELTMTLSVVDPTTTKSSATATPAELSMTLSVVDPSVAISATVTPAELTMTLSVVDPTAVKGNATATPDPLSMTLSLVDPTAVKSSASTTPAELTMTLSVVDPSVAYSATITPDPLTMTFSVVDPTAVKGSASTTPDPLSMTLSVVDPSIFKDDAVATPDPLTMTFSVVDPTAGTDIAVTPDPLSLTLSVVNPTAVKGNVTATPDPLTLTLSLLDPTATVAWPPEPPPLEIVSVDPDACFEASYQVKVYDWYSQGGGLVGLYDLTGATVVSLRYKRKLNSLGTFQITVPLNAANEAALAVFDRLVEIERYRSPGADPDIELTGLVRHVHRFTDEDDLPWLIIGGYSLEHLLERRVINPADDPAAAGGYSSKSDAADTVMAELVDEQVGPSASVARQTDGLTVATAAGTGQPVGGRWRYDNLLETLMTLTGPGQIDFTIERTSAANLRFVAAVIGTDRTYSSNYPGSPFLLFKPELGNLVEPSLSVDRRNEATYIYLMGQGPDEDREIYENQSHRLLDTPYNRIEVAEDARRVEEGDATQFLTQGLQLLNDRGPQLDFEYEVAQAAQDYRVRWDLGDKVTLEWGTYQADARITEVEVQVTTEEKVEPTLELL